MMKKIAKKAATKKNIPVEYCLICSNTGVWSRHQIVFGTPGFITIEVPCPAGCKHSKKK
jgi:hypothetical protein